MNDPNQISATSDNQIRDYIECWDPSLGKKIGRFPVTTVEELKKSVENAKKSQPLWGALPVKRRVKYIMRIRDYIYGHIDDIAEAISKDNGKTRVDAMITELVSSMMAITYYCKKAPRFLKDQKLPVGNIMFMNKKSRIARIPFGVIGIISPWNVPFAIPFSEIIMALLAGNSVVLKTATETQLVGHELKKAIEAAELPEHIFTYVNMPGNIAGDAFLESGIDKLFFTGSVNIGKYLMKKASETLTPVSLELGGNDPMIVCDDADLKRAATGAVWAGFQNTGQSCGGVERIYVQNRVYDTFLGYLKHEVESLRIGLSDNYNTDIGAMTTTRQINTVIEHIEDALAQGAKIYAQSDPPSHLKGQFQSCMVLVNVTHEMKLMRDETFGPVVGVMPFESIDDAIRLANGSYLGLTASIWTKNRKKAMRIAKRIQAGAITINDHLMSHGLPETPWGGFKQSGIGRTHGRLGFDEMTEPQVIINDTMSFTKKNLWWHPFDIDVYRGGKGIVSLLYGNSISQRITGFINLLKVLPRMFKSNL
ncbi:MAG: aldehyde dehydrogenase family protein [Spirochaetes bacterium]|nr:aldehyde dehydrogenase family protein [Spirochaetota bacterium]